MPQHFAARIIAGSSAGLIIVPQQLMAAKVVEELLLIWTATEPPEWIDRIVYLPL
jgi:hypothetical protein